MNLPDNKCISSWQRAHEILWSLLPAARQSIKPGGYDITPTSIMNCAEREGITFSLQLVPQWGLHESGKDMYSKLELHDLMFHGRNFPDGEVILIHDGCFAGGEPIVCTGDSLRSFIAASPQFIFDGDVVFIWSAERVISIFHHEGQYAHIESR